ncbi:MAG: hypothetical protein ACRDX8_07165 [Acidimicrobiales bacterium]
MPPNKLSKAESDAILGALRSERFVDASPAQAYYVLLDEGIYLGSISSFYRVLRANGEVSERRRPATHPPRTRPELVARAPLAVWSWDITKLKGPTRGEYYDLYVVLDIFSRCWRSREPRIFWSTKFAVSEGGWLLGSMLAELAGEVKHPHGRSA